MTDIPTEHFEHAEHAAHAAELGDKMLTMVSITIAILAVIAATVGSLETIETAAAIGDKNHAVLYQNQASDSWSHYQSKSLKKNLYDVAGELNESKAAYFKERARTYESEQQEIQKQAEGYKHQSDEALESSEKHEGRHHLLTIAVTLLHVSIAVATISIIMRGQRWPWYSSLALGVAGTMMAVYTYIGGAH